MEMKPGYKLTDIGVIPEEWEFKLLPDVVEITNGRAHEQFVVNDGKYALVNAKFIASDGKVRKYTNKNLCAASCGTIILVMSDVPNGRALARCFLVDEDDRYAVNQSVCALKVRRDDPTFLFYVLNRNPYFLRFDDGVQQTHLLSPVFQRCPIALPSSMNEQRAIAGALGDTDALLSGLDRLIAKKRDLKQAAMQQLLTGQTRLPGFQGEWELKRLGELADMGSGGTPLSSVPAFYGGGIPWVSISDMTSSGRLIAGTEKTLTSLGVERSAAQLFPAGTVLYAMYASLGECCIAGVPVTTSQAILGIRPKQRLVADFLYYFLLSMKATVRTFGQQGTQANLNKGIVQDFRIALPSREEQMAIATVLSDMDAELTTLEARRDKTRALKQGMMQELLTGRTRLV